VKSSPPVSDSEWWEEEVGDDAMTTEVGVVSRERLRDRVESVKGCL